MDSSDLFTTREGELELKADEIPVDYSIPSNDIGVSNEELETNELKGESKSIDYTIETASQVGKDEELSLNETKQLITGKNVGGEFNNTPIELNDNIIIEERENKIDFQQYALKNVKEAEDDYDVVIKKQLDEYVPEIVDGSITTDKLANEAVTSAKIASKTIETGNIAENAVTTSEIADAAIITSKIGDDQVTTDKIGNNQVTPAKISSATFSTTEQEIGKWNDGKTLYRRVYEGFSLSSETTIDTITGITAITVLGWYYNNDGFTQPIGQGFGTSTSRIFYDKSSSNLKVQASGGLVSGFSGRAIIEYTKDNES